MKITLYFSGFLALVATVPAVFQNSSLATNANAAELQAATASNYISVVVTDGGTLSGAIKASGAPPKVEMLQVTRNNELCGNSKHSEVLLVGETGGVKNAVIQILNVKKGKAFTTPSKNPTVDQKACVYVPHVQAIPVGSKLELINSDPILHNIHGYLDGTKTLFNVAMPLENQKIPKTITSPGIIRLQCDAGHTWMSGYVVVADNPYYAVTDEQGNFKITEIPAGSYQLRVWHEKLGERIQTVKIDSGATTQLNVDFAAK